MPHELAIYFVRPADIAKYRSEYPDRNVRAHAGVGLGKVWTVDPDGKVEVRRQDDGATSGEPEAPCDCVLSSRHSLPG